MAEGAGGRNGNGVGRASALTMNVHRVDDTPGVVRPVRWVRPKKLGRPFTHWSIRKLADYLATNPNRRVVVGRERLRQLLRRNDISLQRTRTWKESTDPNKEAKLDRIEEVTNRFPDRCFAF